MIAPAMTCTALHIWRIIEHCSEYKCSAYRFNKLSIISALHKQRQQLRLRHLPFAELNSDVSRGIHVAPQCAVQSGAQTITAQFRVYAIKSLQMHTMQSRMSTVQTHRCRSCNHSRQFSPRTKRSTHTSLPPSPASSIVSVLPRAVHTSSSSFTTDSSIAASYRRLLRMQSVTRQVPAPVKPFSQSCEEHLNKTNLRKAGKLNSNACPFTRA
jgi:hypothetical protein